MLRKILTRIVSHPFVAVFAVFVVFGLLCLVALRTGATPEARVIQIISDFQSLYLTLGGIVLTCAVAYLALPPERFRATVRSETEHSIRTIYVTEQDKTQSLERVARFFSENCVDSVDGAEELHFIIASFERLSRDRGRGKHVPPEFLRIVNDRRRFLANMSLYFANTKDFHHAGLIAGVSLAVVSFAEAVVMVYGPAQPTSFSYAILFTEKIISFCLWMGMIFVGVIAVMRYYYSKEVIKLLNRTRRELERKNVERAYDDSR